MHISNDQTWAMFWFGVVVVICGLIGSCPVMNNNEDARKAQDMKVMIDNGTSPIEARCAVYGYMADDNDKSVCISVAVSNAVIKSSSIVLGK